MKKILFLLTMCMSSFIHSQAEVEKGQLVVKFKEKQQTKQRVVTSCDVFKNAKLKGLHKELGVSKYENSFNEKQTFLIYFKNDSISVKQAIEKYIKTGLFEYVEPNNVVKGLGVSGTASELEEFTPNDNRYEYQWWAKNNGGTGVFKDFRYAKKGSDIKLEPAWEIEKGDPNLIIAVIDTGLKTDHPEFEGRVWVNKKEIPNNGKDDDGNGYIDDVNGWNMAYKNKSVRDDQGHGTNCAGILGANNDNNIGYAGVNGKSKIMAVKVLDSRNRGNSHNFAEGLRYAVDNGAKVINMSLGTDTNERYFQEAVDYAYSKGAIVIAATGNDNTSRKMYPAAYDKVISVGATDLDDKRCRPYNTLHNGKGGSNYGSHLDVVAPGNYIFGLSHNSNYKYDIWFSGTSQASPIVAGVVSLMLSINPNLTFEQIRKILTETAEDQVGKAYEDKKGFDEYYGYGRINAHKALLETKKTIGGGSKDTDGDGVSDDKDAFPNDPAETVDTDKDGVGNNADKDDDNDGFTDEEEKTSGTDPLDAKSHPKKNKEDDMDKDGIPDSKDDDIDGDGVKNNKDAFPKDPSETIDTDKDGVGNNADKDDDNDGYPDEVEKSSGTDPLDAKSHPNDMDKDGTPDSKDDDIDGDGVKNNEDAFPKDPSETIDTDKDGIGNNADKDDDGDGFTDEEEKTSGTDPLDPKSHPKGNGSDDPKGGDDNTGNDDDSKDGDDVDVKRISTCGTEFNINLIAPKSVLIYPNPSNGDFSLKTKSKGNFNMTISNSAGVVMYKDKVLNKSKINLSNELKSGIYHVRIENNDEVFFRKIIVK